jgi:hypothetical protein
MYVYIEQHMYICIDISLRTSSSDGALDLAFSKILAFSQMFSSAVASPVFRVQGSGFRV